jgi:peroxiredoxin
MKTRKLLVLFGALVVGAATAAHAAAPGEIAPAFTVADASGRPVKLADYRGKYVVLEWTNPECPFVQKHYNSRNMQALQKEYGARDVVWLAVNSTSRDNAEYKSGAQMTDWMRVQDASPRAVLIDETSAAGRAYGAKTTPHMFVIDPQGRVVYAGAIDDKRSANPADVKTARNHVKAALDESLAGKPVTVANTAPYGCSVKY